MNSDIMPCDDQRLKRLLAADDHDIDSDPWMQHVEQCAQCQSRLRELAADDDDWRMTVAVLAREDDAVPCFGRGHETQASWNEAMARQLLQPPSHPEMLGRLGRYEVERMIGSGGMGIVFKAFDTELNRVVAVKVLAPYLSARGSARKRFAREARAAAGVRDDHVVPIFNVESEHEPPFLVMQYVAGGSLQEKLDRDGPLEVAEVLRIGLQTAKGLAAAHAQGLIHRDVKPSNILLDEGVERALLTDFGLARAEDDACLTRSGFHPGTPHYMSPEQVRGEAIDGRSDLFSLGCVLYALCTGHSPFRADTSYAVMRRITDEAPRSIRELNANIPAWLEGIVMKLLSKSRDDRFDSAEEVAELLEGCLAHVQEPTSTPLPVDGRAFNGKPQASTLQIQSRLRLAVERFRDPPIRKFTAAAAFGFSLLFAGVLIVLELNKGTLTIESELDDVPIRIVQGDKVVEDLTVSREGKTTRIAAGKYRVEIESEFDSAVIENDVVTISRGGTGTIKVTHKAYGDPGRSQDHANAISSGDTIAVSIHAVLPLPQKDGETPFPPVTTLSASKTVTGYPVRVLGDGTVRLPLLEPIALRGMSITEAEQVIADAYVGKEILAKTHANVLLERVAENDPLSASLIQPGATVAVYLPGLLPADSSTSPPVTFSPSGHGVTGFQREVAADGKLKLPYMEPINIAGQTVREAEETIAKAVIKNQILREDEAYPMLTLVSSGVLTAEEKEAASRTEFLKRIPEAGTVLVMLDDGSQLSEQMLPVARRVAESASIPFIDQSQKDATWIKSASGIATPHKRSGAGGPQFVLIKDRQQVAIRNGLLTDKRLRDFVRLADDWLTPTSTGVKENSLVRIDCYINPGNGNVGKQIGGAYPLTTAVVAVYEDQALLLGPDSIAEYIDKGYACVARVRDEHCDQKQLPLDVAQNGPVPLLGRDKNERKPVSSATVTLGNGETKELPIDISGYPASITEPQDAYDVGAAIYHIRGAHGLSSVRLADIEYSPRVDQQVLSCGFHRDGRSLPVIDFGSIIYWQSQRVKSTDSSSFGSNVNGAELMDVLCPTIPAPTGCTFNEHGQLIGKYGLGSPTEKDMTHTVFMPIATHSVLQAALENIEDEGLKNALRSSLMPMPAESDTNSAVKRSKHKAAASRVQRELERAESLLEEIPNQADKLPRRTQNIATTPTLAEATAQFNQQSAEDRRTLFNPPIPDLTEVQLREGFRQAADQYRKVGESDIAAVLEKIVETGRLPEGMGSNLVASGVSTRSETGEIETQQIAPALIIKRSDSSHRLVLLRSLELLYRKTGTSSKAYGDPGRSQDHANAMPTTGFATPEELPTPEELLRQITRIMEAGRQSELVKLMTDDAVDECVEAMSLEFFEGDTREIVAAAISNMGEDAQ